MKRADEMERSIEKLKLRTRRIADSRILEDASDALQRADRGGAAATFAGRWGKIMKSRTLRFASAAALLATAFALYAFLGNQQTLYARVIEGIENARTIHAIAKTFDNGRWVKEADVWYERGRGVAEIVWKDGAIASKRIDDGTHMWVYKADNGLTIRSKSIDPMGAVGEMLETEQLRDQRLQDGGFTRDPGNDRPDDGQWLAYARYGKTQQAILWVDQAKRFRVLEERRPSSDQQDNGWETYCITEVQYDIDIPPSVFAPEFGESTRIVEVDAMLDEQFDPKQAVFTKEALGLTFSVHELAKCKGNAIFVVSSIGPTDAVRKKVRSSDGSAWNYGRYEFGASWKRLDKHGRARAFRPLNLAEVYHAGRQIRWTLFLPHGFDGKGPKECELEVHLYTIGRLQADRSRKGLPTQQRSKPMAVLPLPETPETLSTPEEVMHQVYSTIAAFEPYVASAKLELRHVPFTDEEMEAEIKKHPDDGIAKLYRSDKSQRLLHGRSTRPSEMRTEDWITDRVSQLLEMEQ